MTAGSLSWSVLLFLPSGSVSFPRFVVPDSRELTIKIRRTGHRFTSAVDTLYLKGARQRGEHRVEGGTDPEVNPVGRGRATPRRRQLGNAALGFAIASGKAPSENSSNSRRMAVVRSACVLCTVCPLFEMPQGYSPALDNVGCGYDLGKPDTFSNRAQQRWAMMMRTLQGWFQ